MISFLTGLALLAAGAIIYGRVSEKVIKPTEYILNAQIGFRLPWAVSYIGAGVLSFAYGVVLAVYGGGVRREPKKLKRYRNIWKSQSSQTWTAPTGMLTPTRAVSRRKAAANG